MSVLAQTQPLPSMAGTEESLLSCLMLEDTGADTLRKCRDAGLTDGTFTFAPHGKVFQLVAECHDAGTHAGIGDELIRTHPTHVALLLQLTGADSVQTSTHVGKYIRDIMRADRVRKLRTIAAVFTDAASQSDPDPDRLLEQLRKSVVQLEPHAPASGLLDKLEARRLRASMPPPEPVTRLFLAGKPIATPGNLVTMISKSKTGKTAAGGAMIASAVAASLGNRDVDTLKFSATNPNGKALILIDTEQAPADAHSCYMRALRRANTDQDPAWLHPYGLAGYSAQELRTVLGPALAHAAQVNGGVFAVVLDGVADFVSDVNDPKECNPFVAELHALAIQYDCPIVCVIHSNEGAKAGDDGRGHLGKQLTRKAESNLLLKKVGDVTTITSEKQRKAPITEADGVAFKWSDEEGRHVTCDAPGSAREAQKTAELRDLANEVFGTDRTVRRMELERRIGDARNLKGNTPGRRVDAMKALGVIRVTSFGMYERIS